jgi:hypothetical protein
MQLFVYIRSINRTGYVVVKKVDGDKLESKDGDLQACRNWRSEKHFSATALLKVENWEALLSCSSAETGEVRSASQLWPCRNWRSEKRFPTLAIQ